MDDVSQLLGGSWEQLQLEWLMSGKGCMELLPPAHPGNCSGPDFSPVALPASTARLQAPVFLLTAQCRWIDWPVRRPHRAGR